jgi:hypothetical protein
MEEKMNEDREITLEEYCAKLPDFHAVNRELQSLRWKEKHPLREFWHQCQFKIRFWGRK